MNRRYLALWFPYLPCELARRSLDCARDEGGGAGPPPFALVERAGNALRLAAVDPAAQALGLEPGLALADARARCPALVTRPHDPGADRRELDRLTSAMVALSPMVAADPPDGLVIDITGCAHLLGGEARLAARAAEMAGHAVRHAFAGAAAAARALARHGGRDEDVRALPVAALELEERALMALRRAGLTRIGDLATRPMAALAARFGEEAVARLRAMLGETQAPIAPHVPAAPVRAEARFAEPIARTEDVLDVIEDLLARLGGDMARRGLGGRRFVATLCRSDGARRRLAVETGQPVRDPPAVIRLMRERIETLADPLDPGFGFDAIVLAVPRTEPLGERQIALDRAEANGDSVAALIDRLGVRLGTEHIRRIAPRDRHLPEKAQALVAAGEMGAVDEVKDHLPPPPLQGRGAGGGGAPHKLRLVESPHPSPESEHEVAVPNESSSFPRRLEPISRRWSNTTALEMGPRLHGGDEEYVQVLPRPLLLFEPPQPVTAIAGVPDGPPQRFRWRGQLHEVRLAEGPERIAAEWWRRREGHLPGGAGPTRDYYRVEDGEGRRYWLFRSGLFEERPDPRWYLHGLFA